MSELNTIKPLIHANPISAVKKDPGKKDQEKKKKGKVLLQKEKDSSKDHVDEYI